MSIELVDHHTLFVDKSNSLFVKEVEDNYKVEVYKNYQLQGIPNPSLWSCFIQGDLIKIIYYDGFPSQNYFTHEILHPYLVIKGFVDTIYLRNDLDQSNPLVEYVFESSFMRDINNIFAHEKMFPLYKSTNLDEEKFTSDFNVQPIFDNTAIESEFDQKHIPNYGLIDFIKSFYVAVGVRNTKYIPLCQNHLKYLKYKNSDLFKILNDGWQIWVVSTNYSDNGKIIYSMVNNVIDWRNRYFNIPK